MWASFLLRFGCLLLWICCVLEARWGHFSFLWELAESMFGVLGACWGQCSMFWQLVRFIFGAREALSAFLGPRTPSRDQLGSILEHFGAHLGGIWEASGSHFGAMLQLFGDIFGMPNSSLFRKRFGGDFT